MMLNVTYLFVFANLLFCVSYVVRDILWLRVLAISASSCAVPYFYLQAQPLYWPILWQAIFVLINLIHTVILIRERMPIGMSEEDKRMHRLAFRTLTPREFLRVSAVAQWQDAQPGEVLLSKGETSTKLILVCQGVLQARDNEHVYAHLRDGQFAGEMSLIRQKPHMADVVAYEPTRYMVWEKRTLERLWRRSPRIADVFQGIIGVGMAEKLVGDPNTYRV